MLIITNLQLERERERDFKEHKNYILSLHTSHSQKKKKKKVYTLLIQSSLMIWTFGLFLLL